MQSPPPVTSASGPSTKTFKREVAVLALLFLFGLAGYAAYVIAHPIPASETTPLAALPGPLLIQLVTVLATPIFLFAGLAFGLDWRTKQGGA